MLKQIQRFWQDINGLMTVADVLEFFGFWLYRGTMKRTASVALAFGGLLLIDRKIDIGVSLAQAVTGTSAIFLLSCLGGIVLMLVSGSMVRSQLVQAEAKGSNLLEDMKKDRGPYHRDHLWQHVFAYEQKNYRPDEIDAERSAIAANQPALDHLCLPHTRRQLAESRREELKALLSSMGLSREGFEVVYDYAIHSSMARSMLRHRLRYDLSLIKSWYDGAPFHHTDTKLKEQFDGAELLRLAKRDVGLGKWQLLRYQWRRYMTVAWFNMITHAIQLRIARACVRLDKTYPPYHFASDHFIWPTPAIHRVVHDEAGPEALADLVSRRRHIFRRVLNPSESEACRLMRRGLIGNFKMATLLRARYDPEYVLGELNREWQSDLAEYLPRSADKAYVMRHRERVVSIDKALKRYLAEQSKLEIDAEGKRALRICACTNRRLLGSSLLAPTHPSLDQSVVEVLAERVAISETLRAVRVHHELTRLELLDYQLYIVRIMNDEGSLDADDAGSSESLHG